MRVLGTGVESEHSSTLNFLMNYLTNSPEESALRSNLLRVNCSELNLHSGWR